MADPIPTVPAPNVQTPAPIEIVAPAAPQTPAPVTVPPIITQTQPIVEAAHIMIDARPSMSAVDIAYGRPQP